MIVAPILDFDLADPGVTCLIGAGPYPTPSGPKLLEHEPQAFRVSTEPNQPLGVHYHPVDQFQVFIGGGGRIGGHPIEGVTFHYVDAYRPYGPLTSGEEGLVYLTLRAWSDCGAWFMPESAADLEVALSGQKMSRRNLSFEIGDLEPDGGWSWLESAPDGLRVGVAEVEAGELMEPPQAGGDGCFIVVLAGRLQHGAHELEPGSVAYLTSGESVDLVAGAEKAKAGYLQLPMPRRDDSSTRSS
jgi:hypothetical protein